MWCSEVCCVRPGMRWMLEVLCSWNTVMGTGLWARALATSLQQSLQKCIRYIFMFSGSAIFLCAPSFPVFPLWFLSLPHSARWQLLFPKHLWLLPGKEQSAPAERNLLSQCTGKGTGGRGRDPPVPKHSPSYKAQQAEQQHGLCPTQMHGSAAPNDIPRLPSLLGPLHRQFFFQTQIHQYLTARLLPKQTLKWSLARWSNCLKLAVSSNTQLFKNEKVFSARL